MKLTKLCLATVAALAMTACDNDLYKFDAQKYEEMVKEEFGKNFIKNFGEISKDQSWDFADGTKISIAGIETRATRATNTTYVTCLPDNEYAYLDADSYFDIPASMQASMNEIKEDTDNDQLGLVYAMSIPDNNFSIIPLRQGYSTSGFELHMVVGSGDNAVDYLLWKKGQFMQIRKAGTTNAWQNTKDAEKSYTYGDFDVRSKVITFKNMPVDEPLYFYLYRPKNKNYPSSIEGFMRDFTNEVQVPEQLINDGKNVKVIGVESQWDRAWTDWDYEDVMFMIVGDPTLPKDIEQLDDMKFSQTISKRYMIEDLGVTDDTDYNDIVVDMESSRTITFSYDTANGRIIDRTYGEWENQTATLRHLGGALPFCLTIGNTNLGWMEGQMSADPNTVYNVSGWNPDANNISISVKQANNDGVSSITFPAVGSVPLIIATSTSQPWMEERVSIIPSLKELIINQQSE